MSREETDDYTERVQDLRAAILSSASCPKDSEGASHVPIDTDEFLVRFLAWGKGAVPKSAERHNVYWEKRRSIFGSDDRDFDAAKCEEVLRKNPFIVTPEGALDEDGRQVVYIRPRLMDWKVLTTELALECLWYRMVGLHNRLSLVDTV